LRKALPNASHFDGPSLLAAYLLMLAKLLVLALLGLAPWSPTLLLWTGFEVLHLVVSGLFGLAIVAVILSWVQSSSPMALLIDRMIEPILEPIRRILPRVGGIDLSPLVLLVVLQVVDLVLRSLRWSL
jgi:YggT family protein